ncbi:MAG: hypothetical protein Q4G52_10265 [Clostridia bacterium]|nr:hypothetical protein [Clostridia bacterium]
MQIGKRAMLLAAAAFALALLAGCHGLEAKPAMFIETAKLSEKEERLAELLGAKQGLYDFLVDDAVDHMSVNVYRLSAEGQWERYSGGGIFAISKSGRLAIQFERLENGITVGIQSDGETGRSSYHLAEAKEETPPEMARITTSLSGVCEIVYEQEVPIALQIETAQDAVSGDLSWFETPERFVQEGIESVYVVTVTFSKQT